MDPTLWDKPEEFEPKRFIDASGKVHKPDYFMPFGVGRRMCLGEVMARMELFLFFSSILHSFNVTLPDGVAPPTLNGHPGAALIPDSFKIQLTPRPMDYVLPPPFCALLRNVGAH